MVALLTKADPALGAKAGAMLRMQRYAEVVTTTIKAALAPRDEKIRQLEADVTALRLLVEADQGGAGTGAGAVTQPELRALVCDQLTADRAELWQLEVDIRNADTRYGRAACQELHDRLAVLWERHLPLVEFPPFGRNGQ